MVLRLSGSATRMAFTGSKQVFSSTFVHSDIMQGAVCRRRYSMNVAVSTFLTTWRLLGSRKQTFRTCRELQVSCTYT